MKHFDMTKRSKFVQIVAVWFLRVSIIANKIS